ncbi:Nn.00g088900.m01.CDS01 [Neocucurbitaria sp. VM-36]
MQAFRSTARVASQFRPTGLPRLVRGYATEKTYEHLLVSVPKPGVGLIQLNRPKALNALFTPLILELNQALRDFQASKSIGAIVLTGSDRAFAAGADIKEMKDLTFSDAYGQDFIESWSDLVTFLKKPLITAVNGHALGGGCELAMMGDIIYAGPKANFGQPEIKLGVIPGAGGSQRLTKAIGKSRAMETILTGDNISAKQAGEWGLVAKVFETPEECVNGAIATAEKIASYSQIAVKACKEVVNKSQDLGIREGVEYERRVFHGLFGSQDQKIGMSAFAAKEKAQWTNK